MERDLRKLQAIADVQALTEVFIKWTENSDNEELQSAFNCWARTTEWIIYLETERQTFDQIINRLSEEKHEALKEQMRLKDVEEKLIKAEAMIKKYFV